MTTTKPDDRAPILGSTWFTCPDGIIGVVRVQTEYEGIRYFIGTGAGRNQQADTESIAGWGATFPANAGDALFGISATATKATATPEKAAADFGTWWANEGSAMRPNPGEDQEQHAKRIAQIAWANGSYREDEDARWREHVRKWKEANGI